MRKLILFVLIVITSFENCAQTAQPVFTGAITKNRERLHKHLLENTINKNLGYPLSENTEDRWEDAFYALELFRQNNLFADQKVKLAVADIQNRSASFQRALLELLFNNYPQTFLAEVKAFLETTTDPKLFAMAGEYVLQNAKTKAEKNYLLTLANKRAASPMAGPHLEQFLFNISQSEQKNNMPSFHSFLEKDYLPGNVLLISFQRKNRDYPGLVMVRDAAGNFVQSNNGYFAVPQLARSINNLPGYITNGNTPEGILRMDGFDISKSSMIGPTTNIQLTLPFEFDARHFFRDSSLTDSIGNISMYKNLLPENFREYYPLQQTFFAGNAGRTEIISHGTTVNPAYYAGFPYYPLTPTMGCLCTKELWSNVDGKRMESDQQLLVDAIAKAGGPHGYAIVLNIDDEKAPVQLSDILPYLKLAGQK